MSQNKITTFVQNNLTVTIITALVVGGGITAVGFSAFDSLTKPAQKSSFVSTITSQSILTSSSSSSNFNSSSNILSSSVTSISILNSSTVNSSSSLEPKIEVVQEPIKESPKKEQAKPDKTVTTIEAPKIVNELKKLSYTNQYYPEFKINYDSSWKLEKQNVESSSKGLLDGTLYFKKSNQELKVELKPASRKGGGCNIYGQIPGLYSGISTKEKTYITKEIYREIFQYDKSKADPVYSISELDSQTPKNAFQYFRESTSCELGRLKTNINSSEYAPQVDSKGGYVLYEVYISYIGDPSTFEQADQIIKNSVFPFQ